MNRRSFLTSLMAACTLDPERLLYRPGAKLISIPKPRKLRVFTVQDWIQMDNLCLRHDGLFAVGNRFSIAGIYDAA